MIPFRKVALDAFWWVAMGVQAEKAYKHLTDRMMYQAADRRRIIPKSKKEVLTMSKLFNSYLNNRRSFMLLAIIIAIVGILGISGIANATDLMKRAQSEGLRVAYYNLAPFAYVDKSGNVIGVDVEILRYVLNKMGAKVATEKATEWGALIPGLKAKRFDVIAAGMFVNPKRCMEVKFSEPTFGIKQTLIVPKGNPKNLYNYEDIRDSDSKFTAVTGTVQVDLAKSVGINQANISEFPDNPTALAAIRANRADVFGIDGPSARQIISNLPEGDMEMVPPFAKVGGKDVNPHGAFAFRIDEIEFVNQFNQILTRFQGTEEYLAIFKAHGMEADELPKRKTADLCKE